MSALSTMLLYYLILFFTCFHTIRSDDELQILLNFKSQLSNPNPLDSWSSNFPPCNFTGITCNSANSVTEIDLTSVGLSGKLPLDSICNLQSLQKLAIGSNSFYGVITSDLRNCSKLQHLDLARNKFDGPLPDFSNLNNLRLLNLSMNLFSGPFPSTSLGNLSNLVSLSLGDNPTFDWSTFPEEILSLRKLSWLYLSNCSLEGKIPPSIGDLTELVNLELSGNNFTGEIPAEIVKLTKLWQLELWSNDLTGKIPIGFGNLTNLEFFDASWNNLEGDIGELRTLANLVSLQLFYNKLSGEIPQEFGDFKKLVNLSLYGNQLSGTLPQKLGSWAEFNFIDVSENRLTGPIPPDMCKQGKMRKLLMLDNGFTGPIPESYASCPTLIRFRVTNNSLSGTVPAGIWGLPNAEIIDVAYNRFEGPVTSDIANAAKLGQLFISNNYFSGEIPLEISKATQLVSIDASFNQFSGEIPASIGGLKSLGSLLFDKNMLSGRIPESLSSCASLHEINLADNSLSGQIPATLGSLQSLNSLNLSANKLSGEIPESFSSLKLSLLDLSRNQLTGRVPDALSISAYNSSFGENPGLCSHNIRDLRPCLSSSVQSSKYRTILSCLLAGTALLVLLGCYLLVKRWRINRARPIKDSWDLKSFRILSFTEQEILNSIKQENLIGKGGSGNVYRVVLGNGKELAVKHIWNWNSVNGRSRRSSSTAMLGKRSQKSPEFDAEVATLSSIRHVNVVKLYCSITSEDSSLLVYEYLPNGSLWDRLHTCGKMELDWGTRYEIAVGAAMGLEYLHHGCDKPVVHRDVKSSNILLDEFFKPRIADFGLAKILQVGSKDSTQVIAGTHGYIAPEYAYTYKVDEKSDVYSFGVVLMELVTGKRPIEPQFGDNKDIVSWIATQITTRESILNVVDSRIPDSLKDDAVKVLRVAVLCTARLPSLRPSMRNVVQMLEDVEPCKFIAITVKDEKMSDSFEAKNEKLKLSP
eukprot:TRINITY_DN1714_c0_g1_i1.p1 TRINITY_DN1714_c0_g1~~TRINITY_DN1714_c0_g1_i1.p1  ORF type:complete len:979 (+),score=89.70 TRINITY_DN1714_c0_g1_i1:314-3250(+)